MHWYDKNGQLHDTDLKTARKEGYVPSVTEIIHEFSNSYGLDIYKAKQMFMASLTLPRPEGITDDEYFELVKKDSEEHSERAKNYGSRLHFIIKTWLKGTDWSFLEISDTDVYKKCKQVVDWIKNNKDSVIVDIKTQETKDGKFKQPYDSWLFQLCAYNLKMYFNYPGEYIEYSFWNNIVNGNYGGTVDYALLSKNEFHTLKLINIMISSTENIPIKIYPWKEEKVIWGCQVFAKMVDLFGAIKRL